MVLGIDTPPVNVLLKNLPYLLRTLPFSTSKARHHLGEALKFYRRINAPSYTAWCLYDLALLDLKKRRRDDAAKQLEEVHELSTSVGFDVMTAQIEAAQSRL